MSAVTRLGDLCTGHDGFGPRPSVTASPTVFCNGIPVVRVGDLWDTHTDGDSSHGGVSVEGSATVFVEGRELVRIGDAIDCGSVAAEGSDNVFSG